VFEYIASFFTIADSVYGSLFFSLTGLHGFHVFVGVIFLAMFVFNVGLGPWVRHSSQGAAPFEKPKALTTDSFFHRVAFDGSVWY